MHYSNSAAHMPNTDAITDGNVSSASANRDSSANEGPNSEADSSSIRIADRVRFADCDSHRVANGGYPDASSQPHERACRSER